MKKRFSGKFSIKNYSFIILGLLILIILVLSIKFFWDKMPSKSLGDQNTTDEIIALNKFPSNDSIPKSNFEWFQKSIGKVKKGIMKNSILTTTVTGKIANINTSPRKIPIDSVYYYVGEKGYYFSEGSIEITGTNSSINSFSFSKKRMDLMKVYKFTNQGVIEKRFSDLHIGDMVEVEEAVDLSIPNINDQNVLYVNIRIFK